MQYKGKQFMKQLNKWGTGGVAQEELECATRKAANALNSQAREKDIDIMIIITAVNHSSARKKHSVLA